MFCCKKYHPECLLYLLARGADVNQRNANGYSALMCGCMCGYTDVVQILLAHGADVNVSNGDTALMYACEHDLIALVRLLLAHGAEVNVCNGHGFTPLMFASQGGNAGCVRELLTAGADPGLWNREGRDAAGLASTEEVRDLLLLALQLRGGR
jgi:hypothetical protein